jgi:hypothetical protein
LTTLDSKSFAINHLQDPLKTLTLLESGLYLKKVGGGGGR